MWVSNKKIIRMGTMGGMLTWRDSLPNRRKISGKSYREREGRITTKIMIMMMKNPNKKNLRQLLTKLSNKLRNQMLRRKRSM